MIKKMIFALFVTTVLIGCGPSDSAKVRMAMETNSVVPKCNADKDSIIKASICCHDSWEVKCRDGRRFTCTYLRGSYRDIKCAEQ
jgi:hypothetical protein